MTKQLLYIIFYHLIQADLKMTTFPPTVPLESMANATQNHVT